MFLALFTHLMGWLYFFFGVIYVGPTINPAPNPYILYLGPSPIFMTLPPGDLAFDLWAGALLHPEQSVTFFASICYKYAPAWFGMLATTTVASDILGIFSSKAADLGSALAQKCPAWFKPILQVLFSNSMLLLGVAILLLVKAAYGWVCRALATSGQAEDDTLVATPPGTVKKPFDTSFLGWWTWTPVNQVSRPLFRRASPVQVWNITIDEVLNSIMKGMDSLDVLDTPTPLPRKVPKSKAPRSRLPLHLRLIRDPFDVGFESSFDQSFAFEDDDSLLMSLGVTSTIIAAARFAKDRRPRSKLSNLRVPAEVAQDAVETVVIPSHDVELDSNERSGAPPVSEDAVAKPKKALSEKGRKKGLEVRFLDERAEAKDGSVEDLADFDKQAEYLNFLVGQDSKGDPLPIENDWIAKEAHGAALALHPARPIVRGRRCPPPPGPPPSGPLPPLPPPPACPLPTLPTSIPPVLDSASSLPAPPPAILSNTPPKATGRSKHLLVKEFDKLHPGGSVAEFIAFLDTHERIVKPKASQQDYRVMKMLGSFGPKFHEYFLHHHPGGSQEAYKTRLRDFSIKLESEAFTNSFGPFFWALPDATKNEAVVYLDEQGGLANMHHRSREMVELFFKQLQTGDMLGLMGRWKSYLQSHAVEEQPAKESVSVKRDEPGPKPAAGKKKVGTSRKPRTTTPVRVLQEVNLNTGANNQERPQAVKAKVVAKAQEMVSGLVTSRARAQKSALTRQPQSRTMRAWR